MEKRIALILSGGGMRCAYSAGALTALTIEHGFTDPAIIGAASGDLGSAYYFTTRQFSETKRIWTKHLASKQFVSFSRPHPVIDIDFLIDTVLTKNEPLRVEKLLESKTHIYTPLLNTRSKQVEYVDVKTSEHHPLEILRAAAALPLVYGKKVRLGKNSYIDGGVPTSISDLIEVASQHDATHYLILDTSITLRTYDLVKKALRPFFSKHKHTHQTAIVPKQNILKIELRKYNHWFLSRNQKHLELLYNLGYNAVAQNDHLKTFLSEAK